MQRRMWVVGPLAVALLGWFIWERWQKTKPKEAAEWKAKSEDVSRFDENKSVFATIKGADRLTLYEGLPHQDQQREQFRKEKETKETVELHDFSFYRQVLTLKEEDSKLLRKVLGDEGSFRPYRGPTKCGGYHPDYCAEWYADGQVYRCSICFGCWEVKVYGPDRELHCDIQHEVGNQLRQALKGYRRNRPANEGHSE